MNLKTASLKFSFALYDQTIISSFLSLVCLQPYMLSPYLCIRFFKYRLNVHLIPIIKMQVLDSNTLSCIRALLESLPKCSLKPLAKPMGMTRFSAVKMTSLFLAGQQYLCGHFLVSGVGLG
jgi:hypothetical protein